MHILSLERVFVLQSRDKKSNSNTRRGDNSKSKKAEVVILVCDMSSGPILHYYQVSSKYSKECSNITKGDNNKSKEGRVVIHVRNMSACPILQFYQVPSKYSEGYSSYRADKKSISNKTKGDNSKSKKARVVILVPHTSSGPVLHFY